MTDSDPTLQQQREQLLKLVAKAFYRELANYGVEQNEVLTVANHLLDRVLRGEAKAFSGLDHDDDSLRLERVVDDWSERRTLTLGEVVLRLLRPQELDTVAEWLQEADVRESFVPALPRAPGDIIAYFGDRGREYLAMDHGGRLVGIIGAENIDDTHGKLEMKKLVGVQSVRGKGIGTQATFAFLYHSFMIRQMHKVYIHSRDTNVRNLNLNSRLGFELEGIFLEEFRQGERHVDVVRMALLKPIWVALFSG